MNIRKINQNEAKEFLALCKKLDKETDFLLLEPGEREITVEEQREKIEQFLETENNFHRLELTVMAHNKPAVNLYQKRGFEIEGRKQEGLYVNGEYIDEYYMGKIIEN